MVTLSLGRHICDNVGNASNTQFTFYQMMKRDAVILSVDTRKFVPELFLQFTRNMYSMLIFVNVIMLDGCSFQDFKICCSNFHTKVMLI